MKELVVLIAMDSFKGSASSEEIETWVAEGFKQAAPHSQIVKIPIADGGEGTVATLVKAFQGQLIEEVVTGPLGKKVRATYGLLDSKTAVIETAAASGLYLTNQTNEEALTASTYGVGELILSAAKKGVKKIYLGLGGSATTDGGVGMAQALGVSFKAATGKSINPGAKGLKEIETIDISRKSSLLDEVEIIILSDVQNPLYGETGAAFIYGPQKGLNSQGQKMADDGLKHFSQKSLEQLKKDIANIPGAGAAGGLGAGLLLFTHAKIKKGVDEILRLLKLENLIQQADVVITGEGKMDQQTLNGKAPIGIAQIAKKYQKPVIAIVGSRSCDLKDVYEKGISLIIPLVLGPISLEEAMKKVQKHAVLAGESAARAFLLKEK